MEYNIYCDESCHLEHDGQNVMLLGAVWCPLEQVKAALTAIREIKARFGFKRGFEVKWTKVSPAKVGFYLDLIDYFFENDNLHFRALIASEKDKLDHVLFNQDHDMWYYKMYFDMLKVILSPQDVYSIYVDMKDTRGSSKLHKLHEVLSNNMYDFQRTIIRRIQIVRSHEIELMQLTDLLVGAICYVNRGLKGSRAKDSLVKRIQDRTGYNLTQSTLLREEKVNLFRWCPRDRPS